MSALRSGLKKGLDFAQRASAGVMAVGTVALLGLTVDALIKVRAAHQRFREDLERNGGAARLTGADGTQQQKPPQA